MANSVINLSWIKLFKLYLTEKKLNTNGNLKILMIEAVLSFNSFSKWSVLIIDYLLTVS